MITQIDQGWKLSGDMLIDHANDLLESSQRLTLQANSVIDFSAVNEIDTTAVSLMLTWKRRATAENIQVQFVNLPANLHSLLQLYGVTEMLT